MAAYGSVLIAVGTCLPGRLADIPEVPGVGCDILGVASPDLKTLHLRWSKIKARLRARIRELANLEEYRRLVLPKEPQFEEFFERYWSHLEAHARTALSNAVDAYNFLEDTPVNDIAHLHAHSVAALVCGIFGCDVTFREGIYYDSCPLSIMHNRWGFSMGFTAKRLCSICQLDIDECSHLLDELYEVEVDKSSGRCNACGRYSCHHIEAGLIQCYPAPVLSDIDLHEVSMVSRPRDPLARPQEIEISESQLRAILGIYPAGDALSCYRCLGPCSGFHDPWHESR